MKKTIEIKNAVIRTSGESWIYVNDKRVTTDGVIGFLNWCLTNRVDVTAFTNWPFSEGLASRYRRSSVRMKAIDHFGKKFSDPMSKDTYYNW